MSKYLIIFLLLSIGCSQTSYSPGPKDPAFKPREIIIDGCEYLEVNVGYGNSQVYSLTHKGNCSNPTHYSKKAPFKNLPQP